MKTKPLVAMCLAFATSAALAQQDLASIEVRAESDEANALTISCKDPVKPSLNDVERLLGISTQVANFRTKLMGAVAEACVAGEPKIRVTHSVANRSLTWTAVR